MVYRLNSDNIEKQTVFEGHRLSRLNESGEWERTTQAGST
jgi:hypothetical protein